MTEAVTNAGSMHAVRACRQGSGHGAAIARAVAGCALLIGGLAAPARASQEIVLALKGSAFEVGGELRSYDGRRYVVATPGFGELSLDAARYTCVSGACNSAAAGPREPGATSTLEFATAPATPARITIAGAPALESDLLPALMRGLARRIGGTARQLVGLDAASTRFQVADARGADVADVTISRQGSDAVFAALASGAATLGATTRPISAAELATLPDPAVRAGLAANEHVLGLDGLAVIVPPGSAATRLPAAQVARILSGEIRDWKDVGLPAGPIQVYAGTEQVPEALARVLGRPKGLTLAASANRIADEAQLSDAVVRDPSAIGVASLTQLRNARSLDLVLSCGLTAHASDFAIKTEEYPLVRRLYLYSSGQPAAPLAQEFVRYAVSQAAQPDIRAGGLVDQSIVFAPESEDQARLAEAQRWTRGGKPTQLLARKLAATVGTARRLSTTLRFQINSTELDAKARGDIARLAEALRRPEFAGKTVMLAGFTDASGPADVNAMLSLKRAEETRAVLLAALAATTEPGAAERSAAATPVALPAIESYGFGPAAPVACNGGDAGQYRNRRVEVWVRDRDAAPSAGAVPPTEGGSLAPSAAKPAVPQIGKAETGKLRTAKPAGGRQKGRTAVQLGGKSRVR